MFQTLLFYETIFPTAKIRLKIERIQTFVIEKEQHPLIKKSMDITEKYMSRYGSSVIHIYRFPYIPTFMRFLDSMRITFLRKGIISAYLWLNNSALQSFILVLWERGCYDGQFESEGRGIIARLWKYHSPQYFYELETIRITQENLWTLKDWIQPYLLTFNVEQSADLSSALKWHQRSFSSSHI